MLERKLLKAMFVSAAVLLSAASVDAAILLQDNFESYPTGTSAALDNKWADTTPGSAIGTGIGTNTTQVLTLPTTAARRTGTFADTVPTVDAPIKFSFDLYDDAFSGSTRQWAEIQAKSSGGSLTQLLMVGWQNQPTTGIPTAGGTAATYSATKYHARVAFGPTGGGAGYFNLQTTRTTGWHNFAIVIYPDKYEFLVDNKLDTTFTNAAASVGASVGYETVALGSGVSSTKASAIDNVIVQTVPEPTSFALTLPLVALLRRPRRK